MKIIPHNRPTLGWRERRAAANALESRWVSWQSPAVRAFERRLAGFLGLPEDNVVAVGSGSAALLVALRGLGKEHAQAPAYSCVAVTQSARQAGVNIQYVDSELETPNSEVVSAEKPTVRIAVSNFGIPARVSDSPNIDTIEDVSQAFGAFSLGGRTGTLGAVGVASFSATKVITSAGQGGAVFSQNNELMSQIRDMVDFDGKADGAARFNVQMGAVQAAVGSTQLERIESFISRRARIFEIYQQAGLPLITSEDPAFTPIRFRAVLKVGDPLRLREMLRRRGIQSIVPYETQEFFADEVLAPHAHFWAKNTLSIPIYPSLSMSEARYIARTLSDLKVRS